MKTNLLLRSVLVAVSLTLLSCNQSNAKPVEKAKTSTEETTKIQVALLLDTSNSMDGLIEQAKSRLWNIVNTLTTLKYEGKTPNIEIALYEYGNDNLSGQTNFIRQVTPLTTDLDLISEKLFALRTNGGNEYCGAVIQDATKQLKWDDGRDNMKLLYIAGNEGFNQGGIDYKEALATALQQKIYVNTIYCGDQASGIRLLWKDGADKGQGKYFNIDSNAAVQYINTPYDVEITKCNDKINTTYIGYGSKGESKKMNQATQDKNAESVSYANKTERSISKTKMVYKNDDWDLVDKVKQDKDAVLKLKKEELPKEYQNKTKEEIQKIVVEKTAEREKIQKEIAVLAKKRQEYIDAEAKKTKTKDDLGDAIGKSIVSLAKTKGYTVE
ncbi:vWA domain-containing protein [Flavobacterium terrisoli]|uniref:vWA domain-containing protein n=1 Tax=Flavobacterium terrisoli TaxID=3242195 RepID=UPI002543EED1|nr:vWA domain-containing protein [Flavobacterium buctense]